MAASDLVPVDTCEWVPFFNRPRSREKRAIDELLDEDRAAIVSPILAEVLIGFRRDEPADWVASVLRGLHFLQITWDEWRLAAQIGRRLAAKGRVLPLSDLAVAAVARRRGAAVCTSDPHFDLIADLQRHRT